MLGAYLSRYGALIICIRMDIVRQLFKEFATPEQQMLTAMVESMGGDAALENQQAIERLIREESALTASSGPEGRPLNFIELRQEIKCDPEESIKQNAELFDRKFELQRRQIEEDITLAVNQERDRIISTVTAGPHDRIVDLVCLRFSALARSAPHSFSTGYL